MKMIVTCSLALVCTVAMAKQTPEEIKAREERSAARAAARAIIFNRLGGELEIPAKDPGILFLNCQSAVTSNDFQGALQIIRREYHISCRLSNGKFTGIPALVNATEKSIKKNAAVIAIIDDKDLPWMVTMPDSRCGIVNVRPLLKDSPDARVLADRILKITYRTFGVVMGAAWTAQKGSLMQPIFGFEDFDEAWGKAAAPDSHFPIVKLCKKLGVAKGGYTTYQEACLEGWAPSPTNDVQKRIWKDVKDGKIVP